MQLKKSEIIIIKLLISSNDYLSSYDIATVTGINRRLIRDEMVSVKTILKSFGYNLISKPSKGYIIDNLSSNDFHDLSRIIEEYEQQRNTVLPTDPLARQGYILKRLVENGDYLKIDDLVDELLLSRSTISNDLKKVKENAKRYNLTITHKPNYGLIVTGKEENKRKPVVDYMFTKLQDSSMYFDFLKICTINPDTPEMKIIKSLEKYHIQFSDIALVDIFLYISITLQRIKKGYTISTPCDISDLQMRPEYHVAQEISDILEKSYSLSINNYERDQLTIIITCKRSIFNLAPCHDSFSIQIANEVLSEIYDQTLIKFSQKFAHSLSLYIEYVLLRIKYHEKIRNPLYLELNDAYPLAYYLARITSKIIHKHTDTYLSLSELANFSLIYNTSLQRVNINKKKVLIICGLGESALDSVKMMINERFDSFITISKSIQYYRLYQEDLKLYDFIISTVPIHDDLIIPCINISQIVTNEDLDTIDRYLSLQFNKYSFETLFNPNLFTYVKKIKNKDELINILYQNTKNQFSNIKESFKNNLQTNFIKFNYNVGLLYTSKPLTNMTIIQVIIVEKPFIFDKQSIQIVVFLSTPEKNNYIFNNLSDQLERISSNKTIVEDIVKTHTYIHFLKHLMQE